MMTMWGWQQALWGKKPTWSKTWLISPAGDPALRLSLHSSLSRSARLCSQQHDMWCPPRSVLRRAQSRKSRRNDPLLSVKALLRSLSSTLLSLWKAKPIPPGPAPSPTPLPTRKASRPEGKLHKLEGTLAASASTFYLLLSHPPRRGRSPRMRFVLRADFAGVV